MKVIQICPSLNQGGIERCVINLANYMTQQNIENHICSNGGILISDLTNTQHLTLPVHKKSFKHLVKSAFKLAKYVKENDIDIIHAHSRAPAWAGYLASKMTKAKYVTTYHGAYSHENIFKKLYSYPIRSGKKVAVISNYIKQHLIDVYNMNENKMVTAYRSFNDTKFNIDNLDKTTLENLKKEYNINNDVTTLCLVGRFTYVKGQIELIRALSRIKDDNWQLILVGSGDDKVENKVKALAEKYKISDKVILAGNQNNPEYFYAISDICFSVRVTPEAFGLVPLEAQALSKIVIATNQGGHLETILDNKTGFLVQHDNLDDWAEKIRYAINLDKSKRDAMGKLAKKWVYDNFTLEKMCNAEINMYKQVLNKDK